MAGVPGTACWGELSTPDQANGGRFYADVFGWQMVTGKDMTPASPGDYYHIVNNTQMIGGVAPPEQRDPNTPPHWLTYFAVADCAAATRKAVSLGATAYLDSMAIGDNGIVSVIADPQGAVFGLHQAKDHTKSSRQNMEDTEKGTEATEQPTPTVAARAWRWSTPVILETLRAVCRSRVRSAWSGPRAM